MLWVFSIFIILAIAALGVQLGFYYQHKLANDKKERQFCGKPASQHC